MESEERTWGKFPLGTSVQQQSFDLFRCVMNNDGLILLHGTSEIATYDTCNPIVKNIRLKDHYCCLTNLEFAFENWIIKL